MKQIVMAEVGKLAPRSESATLMALGESVYKANRRALYAFDVKGDVKRGLLEMAKIEDGIDVWQEELEAFAQRCDEAASRIAAAIS